MRHFNAAPWSTLLRLLSLLSVLILAGVSYAAYTVVPTPSGFAHNIGLAVAVIPLAVGVASLFFIVSGFTVDRDVLQVERLLTSTSVPLTDLQRVWFDPSACRGSLRVFGNGGLFSFTGWFQNKRLGRYRLFSTSFQHSVVLRFTDRVVVISPAAPLDFLAHIHLLHPEVPVGPEESGA